DAERIVNLDTEVANGAFQLCVSEQQLDRSQIAGLLVDLCRLSAPHRMRPISRRVETGALDPAMEDAGILPGREVRLTMKAAWKEELAASESAFGEPITDCSSGLFGGLELYRPTSFSLNDSGAISCLAANANVADPKSHEVATTKLTVDGEIEQRK